MLSLHCEKLVFIDILHFSMSCMQLVTCIVRTFELAFDLSDTLVDNDFLIMLFSDQTKLFFFLSLTLVTIFFN